MRKLTIGAATACVLTLALPSLAAGPPNDANNATRAMSDSVQQMPNTGGVAPDGRVTAQGQSTFDAAISGMRSSGESAGRVQSMSKVGFLHIVDVGTGASGDQAVAIDKAVDENHSGIKVLRDAVKANAQLLAKLEEKSVKPERVVATRLEDDGSLTVYVVKSAVTR